MTQFSGSAQAALDYNSTIIGALELSEKKWVLAVQLPGVSRYSTACAGRLRRRVGFFPRASESQVRGGGSQDRPGDTDPRGWARRFLAGAFPCPTQYRGPRHPAFKPSRGSTGAAGKDRHHRRRDVAAHFDGVATGRASGLFDGSDPERGR